MSSDLRLADQVALVTGAGRGIGRAIAVAFAAAGARVAAADVRVATAQETVELIEATGGQALACEVDVSSAESQDRLFALVAETFGRLDILVNNAGVFHVAPFLDFPLEEWRRGFAVNLDGALLATQRAGRMMQAQDPLPVDGLPRQDPEHQLRRRRARPTVPARLWGEQGRAEPPVENVGPGAG